MESTVQGTRVPTAVPARTVAVQVRGQRVIVECPVWCTVDHDADPLYTLADLSHEGDPVALLVPSHEGTEETLIVYRAWWPFARSEREQRPYLGLLASEGGDNACLSREHAEQVARDMEAHAALIRQMAAL